MWDATMRTTRCLTCVPPTEPAVERPLPEQSAPEPDWGVAGRSAQRQYDSREGRRRAKLRAGWPFIVGASAFGAVVGVVLTAMTHVHSILLVAVGAAVPLLRLLPTPQHIDAWRSGAVGERVVGARLDALRSEGVLTVHDRRVPGRRTNIDHIAVSSAGVFVIDTKNVAGRVEAGGSSVRVAGRRQEKMVSGVQGQVEVVRAALADHGLPRELVRGVLCFTRADLPWLRPSPGGIALLYPRSLTKALRRPGPLSPDQVHAIATLLAQRLPAA